ncbi:MAG: hypothetical protein HY863_15745 [Chloroflexi bacterium]|nr:hypothetical protein [Chloroflexota bacterium]
MTIPFPLYGYFEDASTKSGKTGLADVTVNIFRVTKSSGAVSQIATGAASFEVGDGLYGYVISNADALTYDYLGSFTTASSAVSNKRTPAVRWDATEARATEIARMDVDMSSRLATAGYTAPNNADIVIIKTYLENVTYGLAALLAAINTRLASSGYVAPNNTGIADVETKIDGLSTYASVFLAKEATLSSIPAAIDGQLSGTHGSGVWGGAGGTGSISKTVTITVSGLPRDGVSVWVTTDEAGLNVVASGVTDAFGNVAFMLDAGSYWCWKQLADVNFVNPQVLAVP